MAVRLAMGFRATAEVVALHTALEALAFAGANHIYQISPTVNTSTVQLFRLLASSGIFRPKLTQKAQRREIVALEVPELTTRKTLWLDFIKTQLHCRITICVRQCAPG